MQSGLAKKNCLRHAVIMISIVLRDIPEELYTNWMAYAHQTGLPLEYLIREATTYSVRIDRLGVLDTQITKEK